VTGISELGLKILLAFGGQNGRISGIRISTATLGRLSLQRYLKSRKKIQKERGKIKIKNGKLDPFGTP